MHPANKADPKDPKPGKFVYCTVDGKTQSWATITVVAPDGSLSLNVHDDGGNILGGDEGYKPAEGMNHSVPKTWWA